MNRETNQRRREMVVVAWLHESYDYRHEQNYQ